MSSTLSFLVSELTSLSKETKRHPDVKEVINDTEKGIDYNTKVWILLTLLITQAADRALAALKHDPDAAFTDLETGGVHIVSNDWPHSWLTWVGKLPRPAMLTMLSCSCPSCSGARRETPKSSRSQ